MAILDTLAETVNLLLDIHEISSYLLPGIVFITVVSFLLFGNFETILKLVNPSTLIFLLILSYPIGHVIQSIGNILEKIIAFCFGDLKSKIIFIDKDNRLQRLSLTRLYELAKNDNKVKRFKSHGKLRLGTAVSFLLFLFLGWEMHKLNMRNLWITIFISLLSIGLLKYMRRAEDREIREILNPEYIESLRKKDLK